ncbi:hypothetical protein BC940DRAFT_79506 [Gongronella butleri]|nr:hypothetical protein BC940DRAFT_79506 [Gongronella butleri]
MKRSKKQQIQSVSSDESRTGAFSYLKHRLFHSNKSVEQVAGAMTAMAAGPHKVSSPPPTLPETQAEKPTRPKKDDNDDKNDENDEGAVLFPQVRPTMRRATSDLDRRVSDTVVPVRVKQQQQQLQRQSQVVWKEGYLYKKPDFRPFHSRKSVRAWKLYRVVLRGHKLYLYKASHDTLRHLLHSFSPSTPRSVASTLSPSPSTLSLLPSVSSSMSPSTSTSLLQTPTHHAKKYVIPPNPADFDDHARSLLFAQSPPSAQTAPLHAAIFTEWDRLRKQSSTAAYLLIWPDRLVTCKRVRPQGTDSRFLWSIQSVAPLHQLTLTPASLLPDAKKKRMPLSSTERATTHTKTHVHRFNLSDVTRPWLQTSYVSLAKDAVSEWMDTFYDAQKQASSTLPPVPSSPTVPVDQTKLSQDLDVVVHCEATVHPGLLLQEDRRVQGGTIPALVHELLFDTQGQSKEFTYAFLLTYGTFTSISYVFELIRDYILALKGNAALEDALWSRLFGLFGIWCERFAYDVDGDLVKNMTDLLDMAELPEAMRDRSQKLRRVIRQTLDDNLHVVEYAQAPRAFDASRVTQEIPRAADFSGEDEANAKVDLTNVLATGLLPQLFLSMDAFAFAEQLYVFHAAQHDRHRYQLLSALSYASKCQVPPQMLNVLLYTTQSPHFLTRLIWHHLLVDSRMQKAENPGVLRTLLLEHWIRVGMALAKLKDMTGFTAVAMGLCSLEVARLKEAWKAADRDLVAQVANVWTPLLVEHGLFGVQVWMEGWENDTRRMRLYAQVLDGDVIPSSDQADTMDNEKAPLPYFGSIRQAVDRIRRHMPLHLATYHATPCELINFGASWAVYDAIRSGLGAWKKKMSKQADEHATVVPPTPTLATFVSVPTTDLPIVEPLQDYFASTVNDVTSVPHDFKFLHECSLACEPRTFGHVAPLAASSDPVPGTAAAAAAAAAAGHAATTNEDDDHEEKQDGDDLAVPYATLTAQFLQFPCVLDQTVTFIDSSASSRSKKDEAGGVSGSDSEPWSLRSLPLRAQAFLQALEEIKPLRPGITRSDHVRMIVEQDGSQSRLTPEQQSVIRDYFDECEQQLIKVKQELAAANTLPNKQEDEKNGGDDRRFFYIDDNEMVTTGALAVHSNRTLLVQLRAGMLVPLVRCLVQGVEPFCRTFQEQWPAGRIEHVIMDDEQYLRGFFTTYRVFCTPTRLMRLLQQQFISAHPAGSTLDVYKKDQGGLLDLFALDWLPVAKVQIRIVHLLMYWIDAYFYDFIDQLDVLRSIYDLIATAKTYLDIWHLPLTQQLEDRPLDPASPSPQAHNNEVALLLADTISYRLEQLQALVLRKALSPCYDWQALPYDTLGMRHADELYRHLTRSGAQPFSVTLQLASNKTTVFSLSDKPLDTTGASVVDRYPAADLLEQADRAVSQLFASVVMQDWIQLLNVLEVQVVDPDAWLPQSGKYQKAPPPPPFAPKHKEKEQKEGAQRSMVSSALSPVSDLPIDGDDDVAHEQITLSDIFSAIEGARRSMVSPLVFAAKDLLLALPSSIQYLYCMHFIIRSWVVHEITDAAIDMPARVARIDVFLHMLSLSRHACQRMDLFGELRKKTQNGKYVPGFVETAIASALVSPEVRQFTKAWKWIAQKYGVNHLDTLAPLLNAASKVHVANGKANGHGSSSNASEKLLLAPSLGWIFERIVELCVAIPDTYQGMILVDKRRYLHLFMHMLANAQVLLRENKAASASIGMALVIYPNDKKRTWKQLKDDAARENKLHHHHHYAPSMSSSASKMAAAANATPHIISAAAIDTGLRAELNYHRQQHQRAASSISLRHGVFSKLVSDQVAKTKRDRKERQRIDAIQQQKWQHQQHLANSSILPVAPSPSSSATSSVSSFHAPQRTTRNARGHQRYASSSSITPSPDLHANASPSSHPHHHRKWPTLLRGFRPTTTFGHHHPHHPSNPSSGTSSSSSSSSDLHAMAVQHQEWDDLPGSKQPSLVINLIQATTSICTGYEKREFVFRVVTEEGAQYLLQANTISEMQEWLVEINRSVRHGTAKRQSILAAEQQQQRLSTASSSSNFIPTSPSSSSSPRQKQSARGGKRTNKPAPTSNPTRTTVYGVSLDQLLQREHTDIPMLVKTCIGEIEHRGLEEVGIYRVAGTGSMVQELKKEFNRGTKVQVGVDHYPDINVVADALKQFLRELPEPLLTFDLYDEFIQASATENHDNRLYKIKQVMQKLPESNYTVLKRLIEHFVVVTDYESINHMYATNLAIVFGPTLLQPVPGPAAFTTSMSNLGHHQNIVKYLILHYHYLFGTEDNDE